MCPSTTLLGGCWVDAGWILVGACLDLGSGWLDPGWDAGNGKPRGLMGANDGRQRKILDWQAGWMHPLCCVDAWVDAGWILVGSWLDPGWLDAGLAGCWVDAGGVDTGWMLQNKSSATSLQPAALQSQGLQSLRLCRRWLQSNNQPTTNKQPTRATNQQPTNNQPVP